MDKNTIFQIMKIIDYYITDNTILLDEYCKTIDMIKIINHEIYTQDDLYESISDMLLDYKIHKNAFDCIFPYIQSNISYYNLDQLITFRLKEIEEDIIDNNEQSLFLNKEVTYVFFLLYDLWLSKSSLDHIKEIISSLKNITKEQINPLFSNLYQNVICRHTN